MKIKSLLWISIYLLMLAGCSSSDDNDTNNESTLYKKTWKLVSYGNESNAILKEAKGFEYIIVFLPDGTYTGWAYGNHMEGKYNCTGHNISLSHPDITKVYDEGSDPDDFYLTHICDVSTYEINDRELRLYYSKDKYFKFRIVESSAFDESLLPGCWVVVKDGVQQNNGVWFSNEPAFDDGEKKLAKYWWRKDPTDNLHRYETTYWYKGYDGRIGIWMFEGGRTVTKLTRDRLTIEDWWMMDSNVGVIEYQRMDSNPEVIE